MSLNDWGWNERLEEEASRMSPGGWIFCRVIGRGRDLYLLTDGESTRCAPVSGAFAYRAGLPSDYPVAGDFVACRPEHDSWIIEKVLPRKGVLSRKAAGEKQQEQVLAANVDTVFLVFALDGERGFLPRLLERFLALVENGGAESVILLNKADLPENGRPYLEEAEACAPGRKVLCTSAVTGLNLDGLRGLLEPGKTYYFLGKSGTGKSTLINALSGAGLRKTGAVRESDMRGRHVTSDRNLFLMPGGAILIDAPGLREAALMADDAGLDGAFPDIADLAGACRFRDCSHSGEPGCAVQEALVEGFLDYARYESYLDYRREARYHLLAAGENAKRLERIRWKKISKFQKSLNGGR